MKVTRFHLERHRQTQEGDIVGLHPSDADHQFGRAHAKSVLGFLYRDGTVEHSRLSVNIYWRVCTGTANADGYSISLHGAWRS